MTKMNALTASRLVINLQSAAFAAEPKQDSASIAEKRKTVPLSILKKLNIIVKDPATQEWVLDVDKLKAELGLLRSMHQTPGLQADCCRLERTFKTYSPIYGFTPAPGNVRSLHQIEKTRGI